MNISAQNSISSPKKQKRWDIFDPSIKTPLVNKEEIKAVLLKNRGIVSQSEIDQFLNPNLATVTTEAVEIDQKELKKALDRINRAICDNEKIIVFGDYDVDGICGTGILWETLHKKTPHALPFIPNRLEEGYGLSRKGIDNLPHDTKLIITVDNGIVAVDAVDYANEKGIDVIITDHHTIGKTLPKAYAIVHTTKVCGTTVAYLLSQALKKETTNENDLSDHLSLVALATIADLVPLVGASRTVTRYGLEKLPRTKRAGLRELFKEAGLTKNEIGCYEVGHIIAPRLNAMGRMETAMDSLRLICTSNQVRASDLAQKLSTTNRTRQVVTEEASSHAINEVETKRKFERNILFIAHESYEQGVIGLIAGKLVEKYYLPSIVLSRGETHSKASARSISGVNIIEAIRVASHLVLDHGGHPMAAGFTVETSKLDQLEEFLEVEISKIMTDDLKVKSIKIDCEIGIESVTQELFEIISQFQPCGMGNPEPTFVSRNVKVVQLRTIGKENKHIKFQLKQSDNVVLEAIAFGMAESAKGINVGDTIDIVYTIEENEWNGRKNLQIKLKDFKA